MAAMPERPPARKYYESLVDAWSGRFTFEVTDWRGGGRGAAQVKAMGAMSRVIGPAWIATTLAREGDDFRHTTEVSKWGITVLETTELIVLAGDGRSFSMKGEQRAPFAAREPYEASGEIDESGTRATYRIPWSGVEMVQRTHIVDDGRGLELEQLTPFSRAYVVLRRAE
jgi:hypothetical protein